MLYIGIDLGTSAVKLLLMDGEGTIQNVVSREYPLEFPRPGWSQQDPEDWKTAVLEGIPQLLRGFDAGQVAGIGAGGQMHGLVVLDEDGQVIRPAILWNDGRTAKEVAYLNGTVGQERLSRLTANIAFAGFTAPKLLWMRENEPELFGRIRSPRTISITSSPASTAPTTPTPAGRCCWTWRIGAGPGKCWTSAAWRRSRCPGCSRAMRRWGPSCRRLPGGWACRRR